MALYETICAMPLFEKLTGEERKILAESKHALLEFDKGDMIIKEGDQFKSLYLLIKGSVLITKSSTDSQIRLAKLKSGEIFGEMSFFSKKPRQSNVVASEKVLAMRMDEDFFERVTPGIRDKMKNYFIELLIHRLDAMNDSIMNISKLMRS
jgi:CRP-like cAMP-binding protein